MNKIQLSKGFFNVICAEIVWFVSFEKNSTEKNCHSWFFLQFHVKSAQLLAFLFLYIIKRRHYYSNQVVLLHSIKLTNRSTFFQENFICSLIFAVIWLHILVLWYRVSHSTTKLPLFWGWLLHFWSLFVTTPIFIV